MVTILSWLLATVVATGFACAGVAKVVEQPVMVKAQRRLRLGTDTYRRIGWAEVAGAIGVLLGLVEGLRWIGFGAGLGLTSLMVGAIFCHSRAGDRLGEAVPASVMGLLSAAYVATLAG